LQVQQPSHGDTPAATRLRVIVCDMARLVPARAEELVEKTKEVFCSNA
jgi:hypothetical protein